MLVPASVYSGSEQSLALAWVEASTLAWAQTPASFSATVLALVFVLVLVLVLVSVLSWSLLHSSFSLLLARGNFLSNINSLLVFIHIFDLLGVHISYFLYFNSG